LIKAKEKQKKRNGSTILGENPENLRTSSFKRNRRLVMEAFQERTGKYGYQYKRKE
jgi:hypothetical protein